MRFCICKSLLALWAVLPATISFEFVNPSSHGSQNDFSQNSVFAEHSVLQVRWTPPFPDQDATVGLFQVNTSSTLASSTIPETIGNIEYIAEGQAFDRASRQWIVVTNKDLSVSNVFVMSLFVTGSSSANDTSVYFNITAADSDSASTSASSASSAPSSAATKAELPPTPTVSNPPASTTASEAAPQNSSDLNATAKIGLGVGIPAAAIVGVLAAFLVLRRMRAPTAQGRPQQPQEDKFMPMGLEEFTRATSRPVSKAMTYGAPNSTHGSLHHSKTDTGPTVYEASNVPANISELYAPTYRG